MSISMRINKILYFRNDDAWRLEHGSMTQEPGGSLLLINGEEFIFDTPVDGIALTPDGSYLFYCPLSGFLLHKLPTAKARPRLRMRLVISASTFRWWAKKSPKLMECFLDIVAFIMGPCSPTLSINGITSKIW